MEGLKKGAAANSRMQDECEDGFALLQGCGLDVLNMGWSLNCRMIVNVYDVAPVSELS